MSKIFYTHTDEAPALATYSLLPIIKAFTKHAKIEVETKDISLSTRIISQFSEYLKDSQKKTNDLDFLGELVKDENANIIKLPNISASIPQLIDAIKELQSKGYEIPDYPNKASTKEQIATRDKYSKILGSVVNPVLREGNSDRRVAQAVKDYACQNPHRVGEWERTSKSHVAHMSDGDFYANEISYVAPEDTSVSIIFTDTNSKQKTLRNNIKLQKNEIIDATYMSSKALINFYEKSIDDAKKENILLSVHLKATMMKVSDPIIFGYAVKTYFKDVFAKYAELFERLGINPKDGLGSVFKKIDTLPDDEKNMIINDINNTYKNKPSLAMVDSSKGITNLHVPSDIIIDASMPASIRDSGKMWNSNNELQDTKALIPDRSYAGIYQEMISFCKKNGAFDVTTMGSVSNVGLMAQKAEEYGSHDKTFEIESDGKVEVIDNKGKVIFHHKVEKGDIWRMCQTKHLPVMDWIKLAKTRAKATGNTAIFWLDPNRAHDATLIKIVKESIKDLDSKEIDIKIMSPVEAMTYTCNKIKNSENMISVTGNVLRDYLTDLFPILELGTSSKMLSIVPLLAGGGLFETGAGGSAPKHAQQLTSENHLRWDSLGEFLAIAVSIEELAIKTNNKQAKVLAEALNIANKNYLLNNKSPKRKVSENDNRDSHFYLAKYWAEAMSKQDGDKQLKGIFADFHKELDKNESAIVHEFLSVQGLKVDIGGYYFPTASKAEKVMRPSATFNSILKTI